MPVCIVHPETASEGTITEEPANGFQPQAGEDLLNVSALASLPVDEQTATGMPLLQRRVQRCQITSFSTYQTSLLTTPLIKKKPGTHIPFTGSAVTVHRDLRHSGCPRPLAPANR